MLKKLIVPALILLLIAGTALAQVPLFAGYYGSITVNGQPANPNTKIIAKIAGEERGSIVTTSSGSYGGAGGPDPKLLVKGFQGESGSPVTFCVAVGTDCVAAAQTTAWVSGEIKQVDLTFVNVPVTPVLTTILVSPKEATVVAGSTQTFTASPRDQSGNSISATISWASENTAAGTVNPISGLSTVFTAISPGPSFRITASSGAVSGTATVTVTAPPPGPGGSTGGGGGGAVVSAEPRENIELQEAREESLAMGVPVTYRFTTPGLAVYELVITGNTNAGMTSAKLEQLKGTSKLVTSDSPGNVYKNVNIWLGTSGFAVPRNIRDGIIKFKVDKSWLASQNVNADEVSMLRWEGTWNALETKQVSSDDSFTYYEAKSNSFSPFVISAKTALPAPTQQVTTTPVSQMTAAQTQATPIPSAMVPPGTGAWVYALIAVVIIGAAAYYFVGRKK